MSNNNNNGGVGPCGACKFLRRKCVKSCVFAPYFDSNQVGTTHFAAVHKVFGASNASKLLLRVPPHRRLDAVVSLCYEALSRVRDPVYGCVADIFTLQQQVVNMQAELAYIRSRISMLQCLPQPDLSPYSPKLMSSSSVFSANFEPATIEQTSLVAPRCPNNYTLTTSQELEDCDLELLAQEFLAQYVHGVKDSPPSCL
ncbi:lateral organ boundaries domain-containing protein [Artemisia annua]|uniref:Lateral organ boundaries domain-containing protein n=1 Tax=Artemisia annua TaxID=35608 RepID=A0A2U1MZI6_ARTAN|nr:lateral organ boundaries domain-containing protein [Artemisia annua]